MSATYNPTLEIQERCWEWWQETSSITEWSLQRGEAILALLRSLALERPKILDLGCGTGWFTEKLADFGLATGIDLSEKAMTAAQSRFPHATFVAGNFFEASLPTEHFDVVVSQQVIAHVEDQVKYLELTARVLKPAGYLILTTPNKFVVDRVTWPPTPPGHIENWLDQKSLKRLVSSHFHVLKTTSIIPLAHQMGHRGIFRLINSHKLNRVLELLIGRKYFDALKLWAGFGYTLIVLAQKRS